MGECNHKNVFVIDTREIPENKRRRRYQCKDCGFKYTTVEVRTSGIKKSANVITDFTQSYGLTHLQGVAIQNLIDVFTNEPDIGSV